MVPSAGGHCASVHAFEPGCVVRQLEVAVIERQEFGRVRQKVSEKRFESALAKIAKLKFLRSPPRSIRVIEEEFG